MKSSVKVAIEGCCHGELNAIYNALPKDTELLVICGDFQAFRNELDLDGASIPKKYQKLGDFHDYYHGTKVAPVPTIFIGGNHEASTYLQELKFGGWVAPNIYYLGEFGSIWFKGLQICGNSGIYNKQSFVRNYIDDEPFPYNPHTLRSVYHVKPKNFLKMALMNHNLDIALSHDWPLNIYNHGNLHKLLQQKKFFKLDIANGTLGSPLNEFLLNYLRPRYWFAAHLHVKFEAEVKFGEVKLKKRKLSEGRGIAGSPANPHEIELDFDNDNITKDNSNQIELDMDTNPQEINLNMDSNDNNNNNNVNSIEVANPQEIGLDMDSSDTVKSNEDEIEISMDDMNEPTTNLDMTSAPAKENHNSSFETTIHHNVSTFGTTTFPPTTTSFLALDKCLSRRKFLEVKDIAVQPENLSHCSVKSDNFFYSRRSIIVNRVVEQFLATKKSQFESLNMNGILDNPTSLTIINEFLPLIETELTTFAQIPDPDLEIPKNFKKTVPDDVNALQIWPNNQTDEYCAQFSIINNNTNRKQ